MSRLATRYLCPSAGKPGAGLHHDHGNGKPPRYRCTYCKTPLVTEQGHWGVFIHSSFPGGSKRYEAAEAVPGGLFAQKRAAIRLAGRLNDQDIAGKQEPRHVWRWVPEVPSGH